MKLDAFSQFLMTEKSQASSKLTQFNQLIDDKQYYQNNKSHWEKSELRFEKLLTQKTDHSNLASDEKYKTDENHSSVNPRQTKHLADAHRPLLSTQTVNHLRTIPFNSPVTNTLPRGQNPICLKTLSQKIEQLANQQKATNVPRHFKQFITFNNHHLYLSGQHAELTLNKAGLDEQQLQQLLTEIKALLKRKGLQLKRIIINGEYA